MEIVPGGLLHPARVLAPENHELARPHYLFIILNPTAGRGRAKDLYGQLRDRFPRAGKSDIALTEKAGDEATLAGRALEAGAEVIVVVGGDGTCARVANTILSSRKTCRIALIPCGTGNDFAKTLGISHLTVEQTAALIERGESRRIDVGHADGYYFLNSCGFGFDASVLEASNRVRFLRGNAVYIYSALKQLFIYPGVEVSANGAPGVNRGRMLMITVSNGRFLGGAFKIAPHASVLDGKLDACFFSDANLVGRVRLFAGAMRGTHLGMPSVSSASVRELTLTFADKPKMEMDGELRTARSRTVKLKCVPRALSVVAAPGALV